jgi:regulator of protease activity HflC (stomatin/prohibitin superfamily)
MATAMATTMPDRPKCYARRRCRFNTRGVTVDVPPQDILTKDNVTLSVNAVVFFRVLQPKEAVVKVEDVYAAT